MLFALAAVGCSGEVTRAASVLDEAGAARDAGATKRDADAAGAPDANLCDILGRCCMVLDEDGVTPPGCSEVASSRVSTLCGLGLEGLQADDLDFTGIMTAPDEACGEPSSGGGLPVVSQPACVALLACAKAVSRSDYGATCTVGAADNNNNRCSMILAYFQSLGECGSVGYDGGTWHGLLPIHTRE